MNNRTKNLATLIKPYLLRHIDRSTAVANIVMAYPWLNTDDLIQGLHLAECQVMAGVK